MYAQCIILLKEAYDLKLNEYESCEVFPSSNLISALNWKWVSMFRLQTTLHYLSCKQTMNYKWMYKTKYYFLKT